MSPLRRRFLCIGLTVLVLAVTVWAIQPAALPIHTFRIQLGLKDKQPSDWSGQVEVSGGEVLSIEGWRFEAKDKVQGVKGWTCQTHNYIAPGKRYPLQLASGEPRAKPELEPWPNGVTITVKGNNPRVVLKLARGEVAFVSDTIRLGEPQTSLNGQVRLERMPRTTRLRPPAKPQTPDAVQDDCPAFWVHYKSGKHYLAWVAYQKEKDRVLLVERDGPEGKWSEPLEVAPAGDHFRVALATLHDGTLWIVWSGQQDNNWDLYARPYRGGKLGDTVRLTTDPGPDIWHRMTTDNRGRAWLVWQGFRKGQSAIFARCATGDGWQEAVRVSTPGGNCWDPCVAADTKEDRVWVGWDTYHGDNYGVRVRSLAGGPKPALGDVLLPEESPYFGAHVSLACDKEGRLWAAWDESGPQWGKDTGFLFGGQHRADTTRLYASRTIRVKCLDGGRWLEPKADFTSCLTEERKEYNELPQLQPDSDGRLWLAFRHRTCRHPREDGWAIQARWDTFATAYLGDRWLPPVDLPASGGRLDMRTASQRDRDGHVYFAHASDNRGWQPPGMPPKNHSIAVNRLKGAANPGKVELVARQRVYPVVASAHPRESAQVARIRNYKIETGGKTYRIYRGDLHRHTDISTDGMGDGSLMDLHRYAHDAAALDFILVSDHNMGNDREYSWWQTQQANDLYTVPGSFVSVYGYERSVPYPNGHRNVLWAKRGFRTLPLPKPIPAQMKKDTAKLYDYLRQTGGICTLHTSATSQGTDWAEPYDPQLEPVVELFQGYHTSYEAPGAPLAINDKTDRIHGKFEPDGFVSRALAKGCRLGFQASSDHISTHVSYTCVLAEELSREGLIRAMKQRHTYAATDNIVLDVRLGAHLMGDDVQTREPRLDVAVLGTGPIDKVEVLRNNQVVHTVRADPARLEEVRFGWQDPAPVRGQTSFYHVRVLQRNGQMAWASPIWVTVTR